MHSESASHVRYDDRRTSERASRGQTRPGRGRGKCTSASVPVSLPETACNDEDPQTPMHNSSHDRLTAEATQLTSATDNDNELASHVIHEVSESTTHGEEAIHHHSLLYQ